MGINCKKSRIFANQNKLHDEKTIFVIGHWYHSNDDDAG